VVVAQPFQASITCCEPYPLGQRAYSAPRDGQ
jgi:hypothetical protein